MSDVLERVKQVCLKQQVEPEKLAPGARLDKEGLGLDSLDMVEFLMALEEEFAPELKGAGMTAIPDEDAMKMKTLGDIIAYLEDIRQKCRS